MTEEITGHVGRVIQGAVSMLRNLYIIYIIHIIYIFVANGSLPMIYDLFKCHRSCNVQDNVRIVLGSYPEPGSP